MQLEEKEINSYTKLYIASNSHKSFRELSDYFKNNKQKIMDEIHQYGIALYTTNFTEPLSYQDSAFLKLPKFP